MSGADRKRKTRERIAAGVRIYTAELKAEAMDALVYDAGAETFAEFCVLLLELDELLAARGGRGLGPVLEWLATYSDEDPTQ